MSTLLLAVIVPIFMINIGLMIYCIVDIIKPERKVLGGNKVIWVICVVIIELIGSVLYLLIGRQKD